MTSTLLLTWAIRYLVKIESRKQKKKFDNTIKKNVELHLIGSLQTNKIKIALQLFDYIQSIDKKSQIDLISKIIRQDEKNIKTKGFFLQVNIGNEPQKSGISTNYINEFYEYSISKGLKIIGLMCIPPNVNDTSQYFKEMTGIKNTMNTKLQLSMGMSNDYEIALKYSSNLIRVGSAIFI
jgi:uncharacterized pyridoxal phosphate-containing UPF0001 family protein